MMFQMTPQCRTALATLVALVSIIGSLLAAAVVGVDGRVAQALAPVQRDIEVLKTQQASILKNLDAIQDDVTWLVRRQTGGK